MMASFEFPSLGGGGKRRMPSGMPLGLHFAGCLISRLICCLRCMYSSADGGVCPNFIRIFLFRLLCPDMIWSVERGTARHFARNWIHLLLASPETGGAATLILRRSPCNPTIMSFEARGWMKTWNAMPLECFRIKPIWSIRSLILYNWVKIQGIF